MLFGSLPIQTGMCGMCPEQADTAPHPLSHTLTVTVFSLPHRPPPTTTHTHTHTHTHTQPHKALRWTAGPVMKGPSSTRVLEACARTCNLRSAHPASHGPAA